MNLPSDSTIAPSRELPKIFTKSSDYHKTITMATIAKAAGVSQGAISSLLNDRDYGIRVSEKTKERVFKVCRELGYVPNDLRAIVRMYPEIGDVCVLVADDSANPLSDPFSSRVISGVAGANREASHPVTVARFDPTKEYHQDSSDLPQPIKTGVASKFIVLGTPNLSVVQMAIKRGYPVAVIGHELNCPGVNSFLPDYAEASRIGVEYLLKLGHQRIAILSGAFGTTDQTILELNRGVKLAYDQQGLAIDPQSIIYGDLTFQSGYDTVDQLLSRPNPPTALFCLNDLAAAGALTRVLSKGLTPDQFSVLGCSDDSIAQQIHPPLSTVHLPAEELGEKALRDLEHRIRTENLTDSQKTVLPVRLIERASCLPPAKA